ncbi:hypothetical protein C7974DRAFT_106478 [Boeremia exigua]|uniref:uncharacterized protein n=1 Tax=Boeremia exigua TaxID=749465 RepID=UPI001E8E30E5|nr:uncharacterized protein C7974DRAFT_106478 [Boeremia exigua]KAH6642635.1 hypothetical protein C7974DRAFT_106478 [Boeremia exigua]
MPPKKKTKPLPPGKKTNNRASARAGTSAVSTKRKQQGEDWKQSRLAPDIPLHMTTRRAAKTSSNHTSPAAPSSAASGSRRSSLNDVAQQSDFDDEPAKRSRMSTDSGSPNGSFGNSTPMNGTQTPELDEPVSEAILQLSKTAGKRRRASDDSTQSSKTRPNGVLTRTQSDVPEQQPRQKKRKTTSAPTDSADQPPELTDASTAPNSPEQVPEVAISLNLQNVLPANGDAPAKVPKRLPGRRRQPHPDMNVEVDLRRQLNLKTSYRSVAKVLKSYLDELAHRAIRNLDNDQDFHKNCPEYKPLIDGLDSKRDAQLGYCAAWRSERMHQLERVQAAEEQIQKKQYINRFEDLRDDYLQRCYFRLKQIEREWKNAQDDATDDEDNVLPPTYTDGSTTGVDDRLSSKFASRSRAYVEADRELENDVRRSLFDQARATFVAKDEDANDSINELTGGFAQYAGPDRSEAIAHYNIASLVDAVVEVERTPSPEPHLPEEQIIPNDQATMLMFLADLSTSVPENDHRSAAPGETFVEEPLPNPEQHLDRQGSLPLVPGSPLRLDSNVSHDSPVPTPQPALSISQDALHLGLNGNNTTKPSEITEKPAPARTTHRIMDMLNNDSDVPVSKPRASLPPTQDPQPPGTPSRRDHNIQHETPSRNDATRLENIVNQPEQTESEHHVDQQLMDALSGPVPPPTEPPSPARPHPMPWQQPGVLPQHNIPPPREADESLRRKDPRDTLRKIRELLDRKAAEHGIVYPDRSHWSDYLKRPDDRREAAPAYDPQHPSAGLQSVSDTNAPPSQRRGSYDRGQSYWDRDRQSSVSQASRPSPFQGSPPQLYNGDSSRSGHAPAHQSPYASLPPKPPGPPPSNPVNFRFAHYDPIPPPQTSRPPYHLPTSNFPSASHPPHPPPPPGPYGHTYPSPYQHAYAPPSVPYQAQPPPPPNASQYPPLKIHQYGGQPILPASMAPPPYPGLVQHSQSAATSAFSPLLGQAATSQQQPPSLQPNPHSEQSDRRDSNFMGPQSRPRRAYRSYHAPGTQFRTYNGPGGGRGRGGGGGGS